MRARPDRKLGWVDSVDAACWVSGPDHRVVSINVRALILLGRERTACTGLPCDRAIGALDANGHDFCSPNCAMRRRLDAGLANPPTRLFVTREDGHVASLLVWVAAVPGPTSPSPSRPSLVHIAVPRERETRLENYLGRIARRTPGVENNAHIERLSDREREVLDCLAADLTLQAVSLRLGLSYATVRNHVQHILRKLDAHSIAEAVARWVLRT